MAKIVSPVFRRISKKLGSLVFYTMDGEQFARSQPSCVRDPRTPAQLLQRAKFGFLSQLSKEVLQALLLGNSGLPARLLRGHFISRNMQALEDDGKGGFRLVKPRVVFTEGTLPAPSLEASVAADGMGAEIRFVEPLGFRKANWAYGNIYIVVWGEGTAQFCVFPFVLRGQASKMDVRFPTATPWRNVCLYAFALSPDGSEASGTVVINDERLMMND